MRWLEHGAQFAYADMHAGPRRPEHFYTAHVSVSRSVLQEAGGFDPQIPFDFEDGELGQRLVDRAASRSTTTPSCSSTTTTRCTLESWIRRQERVGAAGRRVLELHDLPERIVPRPGGWRWTAATAIAKAAGTPDTEWQRLPARVARPPVRRRQLRRLRPRATRRRMSLKRRAGQRRRLQRRATVARMVDQPVRFALHELRRDPEPQRYRPRGAAVDVLLRHGTLRPRHPRRGLRPRPLSRPAAGPRRARRPHPRVLDLGGHIGLFGAWAFSELEARPGSPRSRPTPRTPRSCRRAAGDHAAVARHPGRRRRRGRPSCRSPAGGFAESQIAGDAPLADARDVLPPMAEADLVKIDIEGGEWPILTDPRFATDRPPPRSSSSTTRRLPRARPAGVHPRAARRSRLPHAGDRRRPARRRDAVGLASAARELELTARERAGQQPQQQVDRDARGTRSARRPSSTSATASPPAPATPTRASCRTS